MIGKGFYRLPLLLLPITFFLTSLWATPQEEARVLYEAGVEHYLKGRWPQAVDNIERSMKIAPSKKTQDFLFTVLKDAGLTLSLKRNYHEAILYLEKAKDIYPADAEVLSLYQAAAEMTGKAVRPVPVVSTSISTGPPPRLPQRKRTVSGDRKDFAPTEHRTPLTENALPPLLSLPSPPSPLPTGEDARRAGEGFWRYAVGAVLTILLGASLVLFGIRVAWKQFQSRVKTAEDLSAQVHEKMEKGERSLLEKMLSSEEKEARAQMVIRLQEEEKSLLAEMRERFKFEENDLRKKLKDGIEEERALIKKVLDEALQKAKQATGPSAAPAAPPRASTLKNWALLLDQKQGDEISARMNPARRRGAETARLLYRYDPKQAITLFKSLAQDSDREKRLNIIHVLADVGGQEATDILAMLTRDADLEVQREAIKALKNLSVSDPSFRIHEILQSIRESCDWIV